MGRVFCQLKNRQQSLKEKQQKELDELKAFQKAQQQKEIDEMKNLIEKMRG